VPRDSSPCKGEGRVGEMTPKRPSIIWEKSFERIIF